MLLEKNIFKHYIDKFNLDDDETIVQYIDNHSAWSWLGDNIPLFECPDKDIEETYYFRWWVYRKHLKLTPDGFIITEFHPDVPWAGKHNSINGSAGHHIYEGRWLKNSEVFLRDYILFWFKKGGSLRSYSTWLADAVWNFCKISGNFSLCEELLPDFVENYRSWEESNLHESGLFWSDDDRDAMEFSISGPGLRPTLNSYMYADATAIAKTALLTGKTELAEEFGKKARRLKELVQEKLWDKHAGFFKVIPLPTRDAAVKQWDFDSIMSNNNVREQIGYIPWYFCLPDKGYDDAWKQLREEKGFYAPNGPTTAERRHNQFMFRHDEHECLWNGPSWPFATSQTLTAMANLLNQYSQHSIDENDYYEIFRIYSGSHYRVKPDGKKVPWIDENLDPFTGEWLSRKTLEAWEWRADKGGRERGKDYNHSTFCDLLISGLIGLRPREDSVIEINPLIPGDRWDYFCIDNLNYRGRKITAFFDRTGKYYGQGKGMKLFVDGYKSGDAEKIERMTVSI